MSRASGVGDNARQIEVGRVLGAHGIQGWVKIYSYTEAPVDILKYSPWTLESKGLSVNAALVEGRRQGHGVVAKFRGVEDRTQAESLKGARILIPRGSLPKLADGKYYWADLVGLRVVTQSGVELGRVSNLMETGANDVLVVKGDRDRLIPMVMGDYIKNIDLESGQITAEWDPDF
jgi:16S rRNA processing protein RimM